MQIVEIHKNVAYIIQLNYYITSKLLIVQKKCNTCTKLRCHIQQNFLTIHFKFHFVIFILLQLKWKYDNVMIIFIKFLIGEDEKY